MMVSLTDHRSEDLVKYGKSNQGVWNRCAEIMSSSVQENRLTDSQPHGTGSLGPNLRSRPSACRVFRPRKLRQGSGCSPILVTKVVIKAVLDNVDAPGRQNGALLCRAPRASGSTRRSTAAWCHNGARRRRAEGGSASTAAGWNEPQPPPARQDQSRLRHGRRAKPAAGWRARISLMPTA